MRVIGFDFDGTLVNTWTADPLQGVRERLAALPAGTRTFIATNQAGPVFRAVLGEAKYPTVEDVVSRIRDGLRALDWRPDLLLIAVHSGKDGEEWVVPELQVAAEFNGLLAHETWFGPMYYSATPDPSHRKPEPGMLIRAGAHFRAHIADLLYIGDMETDRQAATAAGCAYMDAAQWRSIVG